MKTHISINEDPVTYETIQEFLKSPHSGAVLLFEGTVRNDVLSDGSAVQALFYEAHVPMVHTETQRLFDELQQQFPIHAIYFHHLIGNVPLGSTSIWLGIAAGHRKEAIEAQTWFLDEFKKCVPIWKKEMGDQIQNWII